MIVFRVCAAIWLALLLVTSVRAPGADEDGSFGLWVLTTLAILALSGRRS